MTIKPIARVCGVVSLVVLAIVALGPANWQPRTGLGWQVEHIASHFLFTLMFCVAWPRPFIVGAALSAVAVLLEGLQALTPDRYPYLPAALYSAGGVLAAALLAELFIRARRWQRFWSLPVVLADRVGACRATIWMRTAGGNQSLKRRPVAKV
jgi:hypothetical protein